MNLPGTDIYLRPTLAELTAGWSSYGISPAKAVRELVKLHLARTNAKGKGNRARRRAESLHPELGGTWFDTTTGTAKSWDALQRKWVELPPLDLTQNRRQGLALSQAQRKPGACP